MDLLLSHQADFLTRALALALLGMSILTWVIIVWKTWWLARAGRSLTQGMAAFWQSGSLAEARSRLAGFDTEGVVLPLLEAGAQAPAGLLAASGDRAHQLTRGLRDALHGVLGRFQAGQVALATVASTAPFVGLLGTVWGIYHALTGIAGSGQVGLDQVAGPVGEALVMTAAGLGVAIPAVLGYNLLGRRIGRLEAQLEGFAHDLRALLADAGSVPAAVRVPGLAPAPAPASASGAGVAQPLSGAPR